MAQIYISIGSNIEPLRHIEQAMSALRQAFHSVTISSLYESVAVGFDGDNFINAVIGAITEQPVEDVVNCLKKIEDDLGRDRTTGKFSAKSLDLDLLTYDDLVCQQPVVLPREEILYNAFVLWPLAELAPDSKHPVCQQTYQQLWHDYDKSQQQLWPLDTQ